MKPKPQPSKTETFAGIAILALLVLIGAGLFYQQFDFNPAVIARRPQMAAAKAVQPKAAQPIIAIPDPLKALTPPEMFTPETLFEKINGQAELYLSSGFERMRCQRFALKEDPDVWFEMFIYDMGNGSNTFAVYSSQRRSDAVNLELAQHAYRTANALFMIHGRYYVESVAASTSESLFDAMGAAVKSLMRETKVAEKAVVGLELFPKENLNPDSLTMIAANVFGFEKLNQVYTAEYDINGFKIKAFVSKRATPEEAGKLAEGFYQFLTNFGGQDVEMQFAYDDVRMVTIMDAYEIMFANGVYLAGVHESEDKASAEKLALRLHDHLKEMHGE